MSMKVLLGVAISIWVVVLLVPSAWSLTLDLGGATKASYSSFLTTLRNDVKDRAAVYHGIPMLPKPTLPPTYYLVELKASPTISITIALNKNDLYVVGYLDKYQDKFRAHFFPDAPSNAKDVLFKDATVRLTISFESNYPSIERKAGGDRRKVGLGIQKLKNRIEKVYGSDLSIANNVKIEAEFLLIALQMVAEAARFKYIENQVTSNFAAFEFTPNYKVINLENEWGKISKAIRKAPSDGTINPALKLKDASNKDWTVTKVSQIAPDMGLLSYQTSGLTMLSLF